MPPKPHSRAPTRHASHRPDRATRRRSRNQRTPYSPVQTRSMRCGAASLQLEQGAVRGIPPVEHAVKVPVEAGYDIEGIAVGAMVETPKLCVRPGAVVLRQSKDISCKEIEITLDYADKRSVFAQGKGIGAVIAVSDTGDVRSCPPGLGIRECEREATLVQSGNSI